MKGSYQQNRQALGYWREEAGMTPPTPWAAGYMAVPSSEIDTVRAGAVFRGKMLSLGLNL